MGLLEKRLVEVVGKAVMGLGRRKVVVEEKERLSRAFGEGSLFGRGKEGTVDG